MKSFWFASLFFVSVGAEAIDNPVAPDVTSVEYMDGNYTLLGHLSVPEGDDMMMPAVVIIP